MFVGYDITANFGNYYLFKERPIFNGFISISPDLAPEMESRIPERLAAIQGPVFYHLIAEGDLGQEEGRFSQMNTALSQIEREGFTYYL